MNLSLTPPNQSHRHWLEQLRRDFRARQLTPAGFSGWEEIADYDRWLAYIASPAGTNWLGYAKVADSVFIAEVNGAPVGILQLRHELNEFLAAGGGHIGYAVAPEFWGRGYGSEMLRLGLLAMERLGVRPVLLCCAEDNVASRRVIEKNGGRYVDSRPWAGQIARRYYFYEEP